MGDEAQPAQDAAPAAEPTTAAQAPSTPQEPTGTTEPQGEGGEGGEPTGGEPEGGKQQPRLASLQRRTLELERQLRKANRQLQDMEQYKSLADKLDKDPYAVLQERGHKLDDWVKREIQGAQKSPEEMKEEELRKEIEELKTWKQQQEEQLTTYQQQQQRQQMSEAVRQAIEGREDLAYTAHLGQSDVVLDRIQEYAAEYGECPPDEQERIAASVEKESRQAVEQSLRALLKVPHFRTLVSEALQGDGESTPEPDQQASNGQNPARSKRPKPNTLTNQQSGAGAPRAPSGRGGDRKQAALARLEALEKERASR